MNPSVLDFICLHMARYGVGMIFFPRDIRLREECRDIFNRAAEKLRLEILGYRKVPVNAEGIGPTALSVEPEMEQVFIACPDHISNPDDFERKLFVLRNYATHTIRNTVKQDAIGFYVASLSYKTIVYKGQLTSLQLRHYFPDLINKRVVSAFGLDSFKICNKYISFVETGAAIPFHCTQWRNKYLTGKLKLVKNK